jgi:hypothetical protein
MAARIQRAPKAINDGRQCNADGYAEKRGEGLEVAMTPQNSFNVQNAIGFTILSAMGVSVIGLSCLNLHHWCLTGDLWATSKSSPGFFTIFSEAPVLFLLTFGRYLVFIGTGILLIALGIMGPASYRKQQQALLAWKEKYPPHPWPSRTRGPG